MLDKHLVPALKPALARIAKRLCKVTIAPGVRLQADHITLLGFVAGLVCVLLLSMGYALVALVFLLLGRLADGVDGEMARLTKPSDAGGFLDITLDFIFYALFPLGFAIADPINNALPAAILIASFVGTGASFLAYASMAKKYSIEHPEFSYKGFYYLNGIAEGTETIVCFALMCLFPGWFAVIAMVFAVLCFVTAINRIVFGYRTLRNAEIANP